MLDLERQCPEAAHWSQRQYEDLFGAPGDGPRRLFLVVEESAEAAEHRTESPPGAGSPSRSFFALSASSSGAKSTPSGSWRTSSLLPLPAEEGLATKLLTALLDRARETNSERVFLEVRESNQAARAFYARLGFEQSGQRKLYYANPPEDAALYRLILSPSPQSSPRPDRSP